MEERQLFPKGPKVWSLPGDDTLRFFQPQPYRRPWGFVYSGCIGIEIPALREWLRAHRSADQAGIFHSSFTSYLMINDDNGGEFMLQHGQPIPVGRWAGLLKSRLARIP